MKYDDFSEELADLYDKESLVTEVPFDQNKDYSESDLRSLMFNEEKDWEKTPG